MRFKIYWASLIVGRKFTSFALFYFVFKSNCQVQAPGGLIFGGTINFNGEFFTLRVWGAYIWRGLHTEGLIFRKFMVFLFAQRKKIIKKCGPKEAKSTSLFSRIKIILVHFCAF